MKAMVFRKYGPPDVQGRTTKEERRPVAFELTKASAQLRRLGEALSAVHFISRGNMTHTPGYGALTVLKILDVVKRISNWPIEAAAGYW